MAMMLSDLMHGHTTAEIICPVKKMVVRRLAVDGDTLRIDALTEVVSVTMDTKIVYEPWVMDRGSMLFEHPTMGTLKLCTEYDIIRFEDGSKRELTHCEHRDGTSRVVMTATTL